MTVAVSEGAPAVLVFGVPLRPCTSWKRPRLRLATIAVQLAIPVLDVIGFLIDGTVTWVISAPCTALIVALLLLPSAKAWFSAAPSRVPAPG
ncbi:hypothetical protein AB0K18_43250 [Nonomuraea sp. NPDC049421]|uniref:hypothetical protein n=1 Tax=Nonomuraea sp. NPDC049421 TaxID=3155275 RepID=UPI0034492AD5